MIKRLRIFLLTAALLSLGLSLTLFKPTFARPEHPQSNSDALALIDEVNALRKAKDLPPYQVNPILMSVAQAHAEQVASTGFLSRYERGLSPHQRAIEAGYPVAGNLLEGGLYAENLYSGLKVSAADAAKVWSGDTQYFRALYAEDLEDVGVGVVTVSSGTVYFVLDAGSALDDPVYWYTPTATSDGVVFTSTPLEDGSIYHVVQKEEVLWSIALAYNMTVDDLKKLNHLSTNDIYEGQKILIYRPKAGPTSTPTPGVTFTATFGIPSSTPTLPGMSTVTFTATPQLTPPASLQNGEIVVGAIIFAALFAAGLGAWLGRKKS